MGKSNPIEKNLIPQKERLTKDVRYQELTEITLDYVIIRYTVKGYFFSSKKQSKRPPNVFSIAEPFILCQSSDDYSCCFLCFLQVLACFFMYNPTLIYFFLCVILKSQKVIPNNGTPKAHEIKSRSILKAFHSNKVQNVI